MLVEIALFERGWVTLSANFWGKGGSSTNEFCRQKIRVPGVSCGVVCVILRLAVLIQYRRVTDTERERDTRSWLVLAHRSRRACNNCVLRPVHKSLAETPYRRKFVPIRHDGLRPRRCAGERIRGVSIHWVIPYTADDVVSSGVIQSASRSCQVTPAAVGSAVAGRPLRWTIAEVMWT